MVVTPSPWSVASLPLGRWFKIPAKVTPGGVGVPSNTSASYIFFSARRPRGESRLPSLRSTPVAALRSPRVSAPRDWSLLATAAAKRRSPPRLVEHITYIGPDVWLLLWVRPSCWIALSALHGSSMVTWTLRRWFGSSLRAWREMPVDAASEMMATSFWPF